MFVLFLHRRGAGFPPTAATAPTLTTLFMIR